MTAQLLYLLDTNVLSEWVKPRPDSAVLSALERNEARCATSALTLEELCFGFARLAPGRRRDQLEHWLDGLASRIAVLPFDAPAAWWLGLERARLSRAGIGVPHVDGEIAAIALRNELTLVTRNRRDFDIFSALRVTSWHAA